MKRTNKKGYVQDILFFGIIIFIFAIILLIGGKVMSDFSTEINNSSMGNFSKEIMTSTEARYDTVFDWIFFSVFVLFAISIFVSMFMLKSNPALFFVVIIIFAFILIVLGIIANSYEEFSEDSSMVTQASQMGVMDWVMSNLVIISVVIGFVAIIVLFAKIK